MTASKCIGSARTLAILLNAGLAASLASAQQAAPAEPAQTPAPKEALKFGELPKNTGWLVDPEAAPANFFEALLGKVHLNDRLRFEFAETDGRKPSYAFTNRLRLGYETRSWEGFSGMVEMENVASIDTDLYFVPGTDHGDPDRTVIADPTGTEINQAWGRYHTKGLFDTDASLDLKVGRQRIILDNARFVGNVGWRQFEQTFDAARVDLGSGPFSLTYAYFWHVQRIFSDEGVNWDANSHLVRGSWKAADWLTVIPFVYLFDFEQSPLDSSDNFGVRLTGSVSLNEDKTTTIIYEATYAHQSDAGNNPVDYDADYFEVDLALAVKDVGTLGAGFEYLGSDDGAIGFRFPEGTNHAFNGYADLFLVTPPEGLQDFYVYAKTDLPWGVKGAAYFHQFWFAEGGDDIGWEVDGVLTKSISRNWSVLAKVAYFDGQGRFRDTVRAWLETTFSF